MITILISFLLETLKYKDNIDILDKVSVDGLKDVLYNIFNINEPERYYIDWYNTDAADSDESFSPVETSTLFPSGYGPLYTEENAKYIANNIDCFIDDLIQLLGVQIDGKFVEDLPELLEGYIGTSLFTSENLGKVETALKGVIGKIDELPASSHIKEVIKLSLGVDLDAFMNYEPGEVNSKEDFINEINSMFTPFAPLFRWLLCDEDISFFTDSEGEDQITFKGAEGYNYGIIPILEALFCEDILDYESFKALNDDELIPAILDPILTKLDFILEDPANRIFEILPNVAYFINSNGLDACVKNIVDPVQKLLDALEPMIGKVVITDMIASRLGVDSLSDITIQSLLDLLLVKIEEGTDIKLDSLVFDAVAELTTGKVESFNSLNGEQAYRMVYSGEKSRADMVTTLERIVLKWVASDENGEKLKEIVREKVELTEDGYKYTDTLIDIAMAYAGSELGMDQLLHAIYYIFYGLHVGGHKANLWLKSYNEKVQLVKDNLSGSTDAKLVVIAEFLDLLYNHLIDSDGTTGNVYSGDGLAANGLIALFQQIIEWFRTIIGKIKALFS